MLETQCSRIKEIVATAIVNERYNFSPSSFQLNGKFSLEAWNEIKRDVLNTLDARVPEVVKSGRFFKKVEGGRCDILIND